jgi:hypothetical protein
MPKSPARTLILFFTFEEVTVDGITEGSVVTVPFVVSASLSNCKVTLSSGEEDVTETTECEELFFSPAGTGFIENEDIRLGEARLFVV